MPTRWSDLVAATSRASKTDAPAHINGPASTDGIPLVEIRKSKTACFGAVLAIARDASELPTEFSQPQPTLSPILRWHERP
ncbi:hypothetical protein KC332_g51 [Hortaea werneckii]|nr:hypothetical protein KC348_g57 [Hortaea werneckii]KAI7421924.1 hypothetical protein KC332_g51 [Hortaea werneckii]